MLDFFKQKRLQEFRFVIYLFAVILVAFGAKTIIEQNLNRHTQDSWPNEQIGYLMKHALKMGEIPKDYFVVTDGYFSHALFYSKSFRKKGLGTVGVRPSSTPFKQGEVVLACQQPLIEKLWSQFPKSHVIYEARGCLFLRIEKKSE